MLAAAIGAAVTLLDSAEAAATDTARLLEERGLLAAGEGEREEHFFVTDSSERFREVGERFLDGTIERLELVELPGAGPPA